MKYVKLCWLSLASIVLIVTLVLFDRRPNSHVDIFLLYSMAALGFPLSWFASALAAYLLYLIDSYTPLRISGSSYGELIFMWACCTAAGYYQWFYLVPSAFPRKKRERHDVTIPSNGTR